MAIDIETINRYRIAQGWTARDVIIDALAGMIELDAESLLECICEHERYSDLGTFGTASLMRAALIKDLGNKADEWDHEQQERISDDVMKEIRDNPNPETR